MSYTLNTWRDITSGTAIANTQWVQATNHWASDDGHFVYQMPFDFPYFQATERELNIGTNGYLTFGTGSYAWGNSLPIPTAGGAIGHGLHGRAVDSLVGVFWTDIDPGSGGAVYYHGDAASVVVSLVRHRV